jgi:hypothetical protein
MAGQPQAAGSRIWAAARRRPARGDDRTVTATPRRVCARRATAHGRWRSAAAGWTCFLPDLRPPMVKGDDGVARSRSSARSTKAIPIAVAPAPGTRNLVRTKSSS